MKKKCYVCSWFGVWLVGVFSVVDGLSAGGRVADLDLYPSGEDVVLRYTLKSDRPGEADEVLFEISLDGGSHWRRPRGISGAVGSRVFPGSGKQIVWKVLEDFPEGLNQNVRFRLIAAGENKNFTDPTTGMEFVKVPGGCFQMGSNSGDDDEKPVHEVCVGDFWLGKYEVTNAQYRVYKSSHNSKEYEGHSLNGDRQPAVYVSWKDAKAYADWLSKKGNGKFRLPTEAEWEYAARGGTQTERYWGNGEKEACQYANVADLTAKGQWASWTVHDCDDGYAAAAPVGKFRANKFGLYDTMGNAWEWVSDWYDGKYYAKSPRRDPKGPSGGSHRVRRGGSWLNRPARVRSALRSRNGPGFRHHLGVRLARTLP